MIEKKIKEDTTYLIEKVPILFNYMSESGAVKFADNLQLMVSKPTRFNDPYDCLIDLIKFQTFPEEYRNHKNFNKNNLKKHLKEDYFPKLLNKTGVSCFSEIGTNMLMWSHYGDSHKGICVGYDLQEFYFSLKEFNQSLNLESTLIKINYQDKFQRFDLFSEYKTALYNWLSTKSKCWEYEKEVRISFFNFKFEQNKKMKLINLNKASIKKIYLGSNISSENQELVISKLKNLGLNIPIYKMMRKPMSFDLKPEIINIKT